MRRWTLAAVLVLLVPLASASIVLVHDTSRGDFTPVEPEVPFGATPATTSVGTNATNGTASVTGSLTQTSTDVFYINNTNQTGVHHAKLELVSTENSGLLDLLEVGIDNGTETTQIQIDLGSVTSSEGSYVRLEPGSTNTIFVTSSLSSLTADPKVVFWMYSADDATESAYVKTRATVTLVT